MALIEFEDLPDTSTPVNANNLNNNFDELSDNINDLSENVKGTVLYNNSSGSNGQITLSDSVANYDYIEIFYGSINRGGMNSVKVYNPNNTRADFFIGSFFEDTAYINNKRVAIANNAITNVTYGNGAFTTTGTTVGTQNSIYIYRVVGYKIS